MQSVLEELYHGNIAPSSKCSDRDSEYVKFLKIISDNEQKLTAFLHGVPETEREQHLFSQLINAQNEVLDFSERERFIEGFQLGARFLLDTFIAPGKSVIRDIC